LKINIRFNKDVKLIYGDLFMKELNLNEIKEISVGGTCICSSGAKWGSCPHGGACNSWCSTHGGVRYWSGPG